MNTRKMIARTGMIAVYFGACQTQARYSESVKRLDGNIGFVVQSLKAGDQLGMW
jgi:hypothetical protein